MRAPRHRFSDGVRSTTRAIAVRMVEEGEIATTPGELDAWLAERPDARKPLVAGGYGQVFTADDLFPLLQVFLVQAGGPAPPDDAPPASSTGAWRMGALVILAVVLIGIAVAVLS